MIVDLSEITDPEIHEFVDYWASVKGEAFAPSWKQFNLSRLSPKLVPYVIVADAVYDPSGQFGKRVNIEQTQVRVPLSDDGINVTKVATFGHWSKI